MHSVHGQRLDNEIHHPFLEPCEENAECEAGFCVGHMGEHVCTMVCYEPCPQGWKWRQIQGLGGDSVYVCLSTFWALCQPCEANSDCKSPQGEQDQCVSYAAVESFCGGTCERSEGRKRARSSQRLCDACRDIARAN